MNFTIPTSMFRYDGEKIAKHACNFVSKDEKAVFLHQAFA